MQFFSFYHAVLPFKYFRNQLRDVKKLLGQELLSNQSIKFLDIMSEHIAILVRHFRKFDQTMSDSNFQHC